MSISNVRKTLEAVEAELRALPSHDNSDQAKLHRISLISSIMTLRTVNIMNIQDNDPRRDPTAVKENEYAKQELIDSLLHNLKS
ncbi:hypothetical protein EniLVp02_0228 [Vibrio phage EniLVp02]